MLTVMIHHYVFTQLFTLYTTIRPAMYGRIMCMVSHLKLLVSVQQKLPWNGSHSHFCCCDASQMTSVMPMLHIYSCQNLLSLAWPSAKFGEWSDADCTEVESREGERTCQCRRPTAHFAVLFVSTVQNHFTFVCTRLFHSCDPHLHRTSTQPPHLLVWLLLWRSSHTLDWWSPSSHCCSWSSPTSAQSETNVLKLRLTRLLGIPL